jgi:dCMP deaminase
MHRTQEWWDRWFLGLAQYISTASKDPSTKCGAVIVDEDRRVVSVGYNGFPKGIKDNYRLDDRSQKYELTCHAESNAIDFARADLLGCEIYTWPVQPCPRCAARIIQNNIVRVVAPYVGAYSEVGLRHQFWLATEMLHEAGLIVRLYVRTGEDQHQVEWRTTHDATQERQVQESDQRQHQRGDARGEAAEAGGSDRHGESRQIEIDFQEGETPKEGIAAGYPTSLCPFYCDHNHREVWEKAVKKVDKYNCRSCGRLFCGCDHY